MSNVLLSFSSPFSSRASFGQVLLSPRLQPAPLSLRLYHQSKHHLSERRMPEAALLEQMPPCVPQQTNVATSAFPVCHTRTHTRVHAARVGLLSLMQDGVLGHRPPSPRLYSCSQPNGYPGTPLRVSEPLSALGLPCCSPATLPGKGWQGAATPMAFGPLPGLHTPGLICSPSFQLPFR